jgi:hypothetical protein
MRIVRIYKLNVRTACLLRPCQRPDQPLDAASGDDCGEQVFVPRSADAAEGGGFVRRVIYRARQME